mmetsp:Transcript_40949/g.98762  ORF Transcript_40949/g.98762 Transcript_40949/m.98762 type:complete len:458 (+) Transcript_40949:127-1500(+)|eukprot:CAMPEP_0113604430 /NCGR_PEP_ID=MMETSP0017_2-20120614/1791_1 /TAXON_ID=2856 /ORGANISM="Cylindrotheca closterium" /LENGTH=457 /DNA_ID=CAMNT_0000512855 /DNA_START=49 /DNA_END=1422 /DNA_ORIENTATION=+ /assembly_acc=CAM_ASM_000147
MKFFVAVLIIAAACIVGAEGHPHADSEGHHVRTKQQWVLERHRERAHHKMPRSADVIQANDDTFGETACFDDHIINFLKTNNIPGGAAAVMKDGNIVYAQGYGSRDVPGIGDDENRPAEQCTTFRIASISKSVTALSILRMVEADLLSLDDKVFAPGGILDYYQDPENLYDCCPVVDNRINDITITHLLQHSGGWDRRITVDYTYKSDMVVDKLGVEAPATCEDIIYFMLGEPLQHTPGTEFAYSNIGYCILGEIIKEVTGMDYEDAVRQYLLDPAGVSHNEMYVGATLLEDQPENESEYYEPQMVESVFPDVTEPVPRPYGGWYHEARFGQGAWVASAPQLLQMMSKTAPSQCNDDCLFSDESIDALTGKPSYTSDDALKWYGLGFNINNYGNWWHDGSLPGTTSIIIHQPNTGYVFALLLNSRDFDERPSPTLWDALKCVEDDWPEEFETTCEIP